MLKKYSIRIDKVLYYEPSTAFTVFVADYGGTKFNVFGYKTDPSENQCPTIWGNFDDHELFGWGFVAQTIGYYDDDHRLTELGISAIERSKMNKMENRLNPYLVEGVSLDRATKILTAMNIEPLARADLAIPTIIAKANGDVAVTALERTVSNVCVCPMPEVQSLISDRINQGKLILTTSGHVYLKASYRAFEKQAALVPKNEQAIIADDLRMASFFGTDALPNTLTESERQAVYHALNNSVSVLLVSNYKRISVIREAITRISMRIFDRDTKMVFITAGTEWPGKLKRVVFFADPHEETEHSRFCRALGDTAAMFSVEHYPESRIQEAAVEFMNTGKLPFSARFSETLIYNTPDETDELTQVNAETHDVALTRASEQHADFDIIICQRQSDADTINENIVARLDDYPVIERFRLSDRVILDGKITTAERVRNPKEAKFAFAVSLDVAVAQDIRWNRVAFVMADKPPRPSALYTAMSLAKKRFWLYAEPRVFKAIPRLAATKNYAVVDAIGRSFKKEVPAS